MKRKSLSSVGEIAAALGVPVHRVTYAIRSRKIRESFRAGGVRLFDAAASQRIADALRIADVFRRSR